MNSSYPHRGHAIGRAAIITGATATSGSKLVEHAWTITADGRRFEGIEILLRPWRRNEFGEALEQPAFVVGFHPRIGRWLDPFRWRMTLRGLRWRLGLRRGLEAGGTATDEAQA